MGFQEVFSSKILLQYLKMSSAFIKTGSFVNNIHYH